jgi:hypothetical protein
VDREDQLFLEVLPVLVDHLLRVFLVVLEDQHHQWDQLVLLDLHVLPFHRVLLLVLYLQYLQEDLSVQAVLHLREAPVYHHYQLVLYLLSDREDREDLLSLLLQLDHADRDAQKRILHRPPFLFS